MRDTAKARLWRRLARRPFRPPWQVDRNRLGSVVADKGIHDERVLRAIRSVPRHLFMPPALRTQAYEDKAYPIGLDQTISQPFVVALMTQALQLRGRERVLEVGTGSGYQTAVLALLAHDVFTVEILPQLSVRAAHLLGHLHARNVHYRVADGWQGWPEAAPFDGVIVTAAPRTLPQALLGQLRVGGRLVVPVGDQHEPQTLWVYEKTGEETWERRSLGGVVFVPMTGEALQG